MRAILAHSNDPLGGPAAEEILAKLEERLAGGAEPVRAGLVFIADGNEPAPVVARLHERFPGVPFVGCTSDGEGSSEVGFEEDSTVVMLLAGDFEARAGLGRGASSGPREAGRRAVEAARHGESRPPALCLAFPESLSASGSEMALGVAQAVGAGVPVFGAAAADDQRFEAPRLLHGREVVKDGVLVLLLYGDIAWGHGVGSGFSPTGHEVTVTRAAGPVVYEIDHQPALAYYRTYLGDDIAPSNDFPLAIVDESEEDHAATIRAPILGDKTTGAMTFAGDIPEGARLRFAESSRDQVIDAARASVELALRRLGREPEVALFFSCVGRKDVLGTRAREEVSLLRARLPTTPFCGFYGYGEIGPVGDSLRTALHNETFICLLLAEGSLRGG